MNLEHDFFQVSKLSEDQKNRSSPKMEHFSSPNSGEDQNKKRSSRQMEYFFSPNSGEDLLSDTHQSQIIRGIADVDHTQIIGGGGYSQIIGGDISPHPPGFRHPWPGLVNPFSFPGSLTI